MRPDVGLDYWRFAQHIDVVSWDSYPVGTVNLKSGLSLWKRLLSRFAPLL